MQQEYFTIELTSTIRLGIPLVDMGTVTQFTRTEICTVPGVADYWYGVANFKGSLLWVLDSDRYFNSSSPATSTQRLTAVVVKNHNLNAPKKIALVTQQLRGIVALEASELETLSENTPAELKESCSAMVQTNDGQIFIVDPAALLQQLEQKSSLISA